MQQIQDDIKELREWTEDKGIFMVTGPQIDLKKILETDYKSLQLMPIEEVEELIDKIVSYNIFIRSNKDNIEAQIEVVSATLEKEIAIETNKLDSDYKFKTKEEKKSIVRVIRPDIDSRCKELTILKAKLMRIKDIPYGIDKKIDILKSIYNRRLQSERRQP